MQLLQPWLLLGLALVPAAVLLHVFRAPGRRKDVSYLGLWRKVLERRAPEASRAPRRFDWLLILEVLVITLLVLGLARPVIRRQRPVRHVGFIIDTSASMNTIETDGTSRWQNAREKTRAVLDLLSDDDVVSVFAGPSPGLTLLHESPRKLAQWLDTASPDDVPVAPEKWLEDGLAALGGVPVAVFLVTDTPPGTAADALGSRLRLITVGGPSRNTGLVALSGSASADGSHDVFLRLRNFADAPARRRLVISDSGDRQMRLDVEIPPGGTVEKVLSVRLAPAKPVLRLKLEGGDDGFAADDEAAAVLRTLPVIGVGKDISPAYNRLFGGAVFRDTLYFQTEQLESEDLPPGALLIADGVIPPVSGAVTVLVNPPPGDAEPGKAGIPIGIGEPKLLERTISPTPALPASLLRNVQLTELKLQLYSPLTLPVGARPLMRMGSDVVAAEMELAGGQKLVVLGFDVTRAAWQIRPSFVVFWANVMEEAGRAAASGGLLYYRTDEIVRLPVGAERGELRGPSNPPGVAQGADGWANCELERVGVYEWTGERRHSQFAVNLLSETESDNRPSSLAGNPPSLDLPAPLAGKVISLGPWLCLAGGILACAWWHFRR